jgi:hypothetical protein|tara:strand:- start:37 stop:378 length:342 start_codon:yes stop_codon:yes gene_type:complete
MTTDNKRVTNKQILSKLDKLSLSETDLNSLSIKIVARMMNIQTMSEWFEHVSSSDVAEKVMDQRLEMTEEQNAIGDMAKYMTLMNLFEDKEEYEKCAICKLKIDNINRILEKY